MDLADRAVDAPFVAHVAPMQDEAFDDGGEFSLGGCFCHNRSIRLFGPKVKGLAARLSRETGDAAQSHGVGVGVDRRVHTSGRGFLPVMARHGRHVLAKEYVR